MPEYNMSKVRQTLTNVFKGNTFRFEIKKAVENSIVEQQADPSAFVNEAGRL